jgi:hypothetical protein
MMGRAVPNRRGDRGVLSKRASAKPGSIELIADVAVDPFVTRDEPRPPVDQPGFGAPSGGGTRPALIMMAVMALATASSPVFAFGATANPRAKFSAGTIRDAIADKVGRIAGQK